MIEPITRTFEDVLNALAEAGVDVDELEAMTKPLRVAVKGLCRERDAALAKLAAVQAVLDTEPMRYKQGGTDTWDAYWEGWDDGVGQLDSKLHVILDGDV
jgi:hypothetical protein